MTLTPRLVNRLKLKHWALLSALGEAPVLHQAAARINVTQPSATKMLSDIENAFGFPLFERHARGLRPTSLGGEVVAYARQTQASLDRFLEGLEIKRRGGHGNFVFGTIMGAAPDLVATAVAEIKRERPSLNIRILGETSDQIVTLLERHEIELAVGRFTDPLQHNKFDFVPLSDEPLCAIARHGHDLTRSRSVDWKELVRWPWVLQIIASPARILLEEEFTRGGVSGPSDIIECTSIFATLQLVQSSNAIAVLPESVVRDHVRAGLLHALPISVGQALKAFGVLTRKGEALSDAASAFVEHLKRSVRVKPETARRRKAAAPKAQPAGSPVSRPPASAPARSRGAGTAPAGTERSSRRPGTARHPA
jgi:DNA-binding transcriptional LysR family regulator